MIHLVSLDPGLRGCGVAWWRVDGSLAHVAYVRNPVKIGNGPMAWMGYDGTTASWYTSHTEHFLSEIPQVYRVGASKGDPDDLIQLAGVSSRRGGRSESFPYTGNGYHYEADEVARRVRGGCAARRPAGEAAPG